MALPGLQVRAMSWAAQRWAMETWSSTFTWYRDGRDKLVGRRRQGLAHACDGEGGADGARR